MDFLLLLVILVVLYYKKPLNFDNNTAFPQYSSEQLRWFKNEVIYKCLEDEIQSVSLNRSEDKSYCYQKGNHIYCMEVIRTSDIENLHKELTVNEVYLKGKLQETIHQQYIYGQAPNLNVLGIAIKNGKFIIGMEVVK